MKRYDLEDCEDCIDEIVFYLNKRMEITKEKMEWYRGSDKEILFKRSVSTYREARNTRDKVLDILRDYEIEV